MSDKTELEILNIRINGFEKWLAEMVEIFKNDNSNMSSSEIFEYALVCYQTMVMNKEGE